MVPPEIPKNSSVLGIGIDFIEVSRIARALERQRERFRNRVFTDEELAYCDGMKFPAPHFAARFAAKEAVSKAFGTGIGEFLGWKSAAVAKDSLGKPFIRLDSQGKELLQKKGGNDVLVSLAHTKEHATAVAVLVR
ncbi:MAG: holo-ACP synthase [Verrucomicrobiota bacterium]